MLTSNRARNWQERGKKTRIIMRDRTRAEIEKSPEIGAFLAKNANFDRNAPPWVLGVQIALGGASSMGVRKLKQKSYDTVFEALVLTKRRR